MLSCVFAFMYDHDRRLPPHDMFGLCSLRYRLVQGLRRRWAWGDAYAKAFETGEPVVTPVLFIFWVKMVDMMT